MKIEVHERIAGTTIVPIWVNSGPDPSFITSILRTGSETVVSTATPVSSGPSNYFAVHALPTTPNVWYVNEWIAHISASTYIARQYIKAVKPEVY